MRRLRIDQAVAIDLDAGEDSVDGVVVSVTGDAASLRITRLPDPETIGRLAGGSPGYLVFSHRGAMVALRGTAAFKMGQPLIEFRVTDGIQLPERRAAGRTAIETRATLRVASIVSPEPQAEFETTTVNVSITGALVRRPAALVPARQCTISLYFGGDPSPVESEVSFVRGSDTMIAFHFEGISPAEQQRLGEFLAGHRISTRIEQSRRDDGVRS